jgi:hypothetical protein
VLLGVEPHGGRELVAVAQRRQVDDADDDLLVGDADADPLAEALVVAPEGAEGPREGVGVDDLAVAQDARLERGDRGAIDRDPPVDPDGGRSDSAGVDVESDELLCLGQGEGERRRLVVKDRRSVRLSAARART